jgi:3-hydroxy acid dehydrogenase / malonic semialdehyde reductase
LEKGFFCILALQKTNMQKIVLITGATSGIGAACASVFAANGWNIIITGRRTERLTALQKKLEKKYGIRCLPLTFDVQNRAAVAQQLSTLPKQWQKISILLNNAGLALGRSYFEEGDISDWDTMIDTNIKGLLYVSKAVLPYLIKNKSGHIINIGSIAGKEVYEKGNVYCGTKFAVDAISKAQRIDLLRHRIKVTNINPGAVETEFSLVRFKGDKQTAQSIYNGYKPLQPEDIANIIYFSATLPSHVCINDLTITCLQQGNASITLKA